MKRPEEYVSLMEAFISSGKRGVKLAKANREDLAALRMTAHLRYVNVDVRMRGGTVYLARKVTHE